MTKEQAKIKAIELLNKAKKATAFQYQEYAGANYSVFEHDIEELKNIALITIEQMVNNLPKNEYMEDIGKFIKNRELQFWEMVKNELENIKAI